MILTRMFLNPRRRDARRLIASPQAMHAAVLSGFPPSVDPGRVLWRIDGLGTTQVVLWMVSAETPDLTHLEEQAGWPAAPTFRSVSYDGLLAGLQAGQAWAFRLTANPTHRGRLGERSQVFAHVTADQQSAWLRERQDRLGVRLVRDGEPTFSVVGREVKRFRRGAGTVTLGTATYVGMLEVVDPPALREALVSGVGRAKAYGCGLLTLARP